MAVAVTVVPLADLTRPIRSGMPVFPGDPEVSVDPHATVADDGYRVTELACGSHTGTHVDAPSHTEPDGRAIDEFPVSRFVRDAVIVDLRDHGPRERIRPDDLPTADAGVVVLRTGLAGHWGDDAALDHPFLTPAAAAHCVEQGYDVATDALNVDPTPTADAPADEPEGVPAHHELLGNDRLIVENLRNLGAVPSRFELTFLPLHLAGSDGAPVRAVARWD